MQMGTGETHVEMFNRVIIDAAIACSCTVMVRERPRLCTSSPALIGRSRYRIRVFVRRAAAHWKVSPATRANTHIQPHDVYTPSRVGGSNSGTSAL